MATPNTYEELLSLLREQSALIVHCAGFAKGVGSVETNNHGYLARLQYAIDNSDIEVSCSTIIPGDFYAWGHENYTGRVGVVIRPNKIESITFASPVDAGSQIDLTNPKRRYTGLPQATIDIIRSAILDRCPDRYNELGVMDYTVMGIFVDPPVEFIENGNFQQRNAEEILAQFPDQRWLCLQQGSLYEVCRTGDGRLSCGSRIDVSSLYT